MGRDNPYNRIIFNYTAVVRAEKLFTDVRQYSLAYLFKVVEFTLVIQEEPI
jgi:hypothetical protein